MDASRAMSAALKRCPRDAAVLWQMSGWLSGQSKGGRNRELNYAAYRSGRLVGAGLMMRADAERVLFEACVLNGLVHDDGKRAVLSTIASGLSAGMREPARSFSKFGPPPPPKPLTAEEAKAQARKVAYLWRKGRRAAGSPAEVYLRARGLNGSIPRTFRYLAAEWDHPHALMCPFGVASEPEPGQLALADRGVKAVQLIKLLPDGSDRDRSGVGKVTVGKGSVGHPIVCAPPNDLLGLAITEGIEDALSVQEATGLGAWASGGSGRLAALADAVPSYIEVVTIFVHPDAERDARALAGALHARGIEVFLKPETSDA